MRRVSRYLYEGRKSAQIGVFLGSHGGKVTNDFFTPMKAKTKQVALYARVSTKDKGQDVENQLAQLREFCERQGYTIHDEYMDDESGTKGKRERSGFARLFVLCDGYHDTSTKGVNPLK